MQYISLNFGISISVTYLIPLRLQWRLFLFRSSVTPLTHFLVFQLYTTAIFILYIVHYIVVTTVYVLTTSTLLWQNAILFELRIAATYTILRR